MLIFRTVSLAAFSVALVSLSPAMADRPNVVVIMSDDQGGGDYGFVGNQIIRTPQLDAMHARSGYLSNFYVSPVCALNAGEPDDGPIQLSNPLHRHVRGACDDGH